MTGCYKDSVKLYLKEIRRYPLLSRHEEIELAQQAQVRRNPPSNASVQELERLNKIGQNAKNRLIQHNLRLVVIIAKKYQYRSGIELLDLIQEGSIGLSRAADKFDPTKGYRFCTCACWWICQTITRALADKGRIIRVPININQKINRLRKIRSQLIQSLGRDPSTKELAEALEINQAEAITLVRLSQSNLSLDATINDNENMSLIDAIRLERFLVQEVLEREDYIDYLLSKCSRIQQEILILKYGLKDNKPLNYPKIGEKLGFSREKARQQAIAAIQTIRAKVNP